MGFKLYTTCVRTVEQARDTLQLLRERRAITATVVSDIRRRRRTADIALQATFEELRHAFITSLDREELLRLRQMTERLVCGAEDIVLALYRRGQSALLPDDTVLLAAVTEECRLLQTCLEALDSYPRRDTAVKQLCAAEKQHRAAEELDSGDVAYAALHAFSRTCFDTAQQLRIILLKIT